MSWKYEMLLVSVLPAVAVMTTAQHCCSEWEFNSIFTVFLLLENSLPFDGRRNGKLIAHGGNKL